MIDHSERNMPTGRQDDLVTGAIADARRIAVWSTTCLDAVAVHRLVRDLRRHGWDAVGLTPRDATRCREVDLIISVGGDPALAADHAIAADRPLLATQTGDEAGEAIASIDALTVENHSVVRTRVDDARPRIVLATAQITPIGPGGTLTVDTGDRSESGLSAGLATADPFDLLPDGHRPDRPSLRLRAEAHQWGPPLTIDARTMITVRCARPTNHLRVIRDEGRHACLATTLEIGPTVQVRIARLPA